VIKINKNQLVIWIIFAISINNASAQNFESRLDQSMNEVVDKLRSSIIQLKEVRKTSCNLGQVKYCELASLSEVNILLLDIETKYRKLARSTSSSANREKYEKIKASAGEAMQKISDLEDEINR
jgi:hypothetical protein